jgi:hypothetical protein
VSKCDDCAKETRRLLRRVAMYSLLAAGCYAAWRFWGPKEAMQE